MNLPAMEILDVRRNFGAKEVLRGVTLAVPRGEFLGIIGPNGAGKTTLIKCALGLCSYEGRIFVGGESVRSLSRREMARRTSYLPSEINAIYDYTVTEILRMSRYSLGNFWGDADAEGDAACRRYARLAAIEHLLDRKINSLSSGEKQMVYLAQALAQESETLILDEPTSHLDLNHASMFFDLLSRLNRERGLTIIFVNHDVNLSAQYASRIALMKDGLLFCAGVPEDVITEQNIKAVYGFEDFSVLKCSDGRPLVYIRSNTR
jgi:iron complex transport system ATP-binding protein